MDEIPTDRIIDGIDQTALLMLNGETHGRRDYVFIYNINSLEAAGQRAATSSNDPGRQDWRTRFIANFYDLSIGTRARRYPVSTEVGAWSSAKFVRHGTMRHMMRKAEVSGAKGPGYGDAV